MAWGRGEDLLVQTLLGQLLVYHHGYHIEAAGSFSTGLATRIGAELGGGGAWVAEGVQLALFLESLGLGLVLLCPGTDSSSVFLDLIVLGQAFHSRNFCH